MLKTKDRHQINTSRAPFVTVTFYRSGWNKKRERLSLQIRSPIDFDFLDNSPFGPKCRRLESESASKNQSVHISVINKSAIVTIIVFQVPVTEKQGELWFNAIPHAGIELTCQVSAKSATDVEDGRKISLCGKV